MELLTIVFIPFIGTSLGAAGVFFMKDSLNNNVEKGLLGFAGGVMVAASVWSLLIPSMELSEHMGIFAFTPAVLGFLLGIAFLLVLDETIPHEHIGGEKEGLPSNLRKTTMLMLAVTLHNVPEGMAVGVLYAGYISGNAGISFAAALTLSLGIALQNFPEGAIISMPLKSEGFSKKKSFSYGVLSGAVEPVAAIITILAAKIVEPILPYLLSFAAGAMIYVVVEELIPETAEGKHSNFGVIGFGIGFASMMVLDIALG